MIRIAIFLLLLATISASAQARHRTSPHVSIPDVAVTTASAPHSTLSTTQSALSTALARVRYFEAKHIKLEADLDAERRVADGARLDEVQKKINASFPHYPAHVRSALLTEFNRWASSLEQHTIQCGR